MAWARGALNRRHDSVTLCPTGARWAWSARRAPPGMEPKITWRFLPGQFFGGLALALGGLGVLYVQFCTDLFVSYDTRRVSVKLVVFAGLLCVLGIGIALSATARGCSRCRRELFNNALVYPVELHARV